MDYQELLEGKKVKPKICGFDIEQSSLNPYLKSFQKYCVQKSLKHGRFALFEPPGSGKTIQQLEWGHQVYSYTGMPVILIAPLAVIGQTIEEEAPKFGYQVKELHEGITAEDLLSCGIWGINYDSLHKYLHLIECFSGVILDESSILKNFTGETKKFLMDTFENTQYKLPCSATPAPNDLNEYGNHSEFLHILDAQDMRSKWFVRDEGMNNYRLKKHAKGDFYAWLSTWCVMFSHPKDIGFNEVGYDLPELNLIERQIKTAQRNNGKIFNDVSVDATTFSKELKLTKIERLSEVAEIVNNSTEQFCIWVTLDEEADELLKLIPGAVNVTGSDKKDIKKRNLLDFGKGLIRVMITKTKLAMYGLNWQSCHNTIFASFNFSFEALYQAIRRFLRFGQQYTVNCWLITTDTMQNVINNIKEKERQFLEAVEEVSKAINGKTYGLIDQYDYKEVKNENMWLMKGDSCIELKRIPDNSIDFIIYSPPFSALFTYSNYIHDMGNNENHDEFFRQYAFLLKELYRVLKPGRLMVCHTKDLGVYKNSSAYTGMYDFTAEHTKAVSNFLISDKELLLQEYENNLVAFNNIISDENYDYIESLTLDLENKISSLQLEISSLRKIGFKIHSKVTIWTDPVLEMQRTKTQRLLYKTLTSDSSFTGIGMAEYLTIFKKWDGTDQSNWEPVNHLTKKNIPLDLWQKWASPVWMDIKRTDVLNGKEGTAQVDEKHIAPLQLEVIHRCVNLWSNPGDKVLTPFLGIGSEAYVSINNNRYAIGCELKDSYFETAVKNCNKAINSKSQGSLFETGLYK
jgi:DNA modification methylase